MNVQGLDVLLVEDDPGDVMLIEEAFEATQAGNVLNTVGDGLEAMDYLHQRGRYVDATRPDLVLLDLNLPRMNGREVLTQIKASEALRAIPVVVLTTSANEDDVAGSYALHANAYVTKPVDFTRFTEIVRRIDEFFVGIVRLPAKDS